MYPSSPLTRFDPQSNQPPQTGIRYGTNKANDVNSTPAKLGNDTGSTAGSKASADSSMGSDNAQPAHSRYGRKEQRAQDANNQANGQRRPPGDSPITGEYGSRARALSDTSPLQPLYDGKGDARAGRDSAWQPRDGPAAQDDKRGRPEPDRPGSNGTPDSRSNLNDADNRGPVPRDRGFYDLDRDRERDRDRDRERGWDRERDRDRRPDYRRDERPRMTDARRPPPDQRHYEPRYSSDMPRRNDNRPPSDDAMDVDKRPPPPIPRPGPIDDRAGRPAPVDHPVRPPVDDRVPPRAQPPDRSARVPPVDDRQSRPPPADNRRAPSPEDRSLRPAPSQDVPPRLGPGVRPPAASDDHGMARLSLGERIHPPPPLQDRITHPPPVARVDDRLTRQPSLEERISHAPDRPIPHDDRAVRPSTADRTARPAEPIRPQEERIGRPDDRAVRPGPPGDRYVGPVTPRGGPGYPPVPRSSSVVRDDPRGLRTPPSPPPGRDYRPARPPSREMRRLEVDRPPYDLDRRPDIMDIDPASARFNESRPPAYPRRLTPPPADRARAYPPPPLPPRAEPGYVELDRRFPPGDRRDYPYEGRPRQLSGTEEDSWKSQPRPESWDREALDKDRLLRGVPPARHNGWETREERERRGSFPGSPARPLEASQQRPLGSRLSDNYSGPGEDRSYPPRDLERSRYPPPLDGPATYSRVRPRSPSPISRRPGPGSVIDDGRPPMKRPREDAPYPPGYYSPEPRRPIAGGPSDYPTRSGQTPRPDGGAAYYDARLPPVRSGPPPYDRDYPVARDRGSEVGGYVSGPSSYDRPPRSPPPRPPPQIYPSRGNYTRGGGDPRDDRAYGSNMPPPPRSG